MRLFRAVSLTEGVSWLLLLFVAMPLKYGMGEPAMVRVVGRAHGALFVAFVVTLAWAAVEAKWDVRKVARAFVASVLPFGAFWLERQLRREAAALPE